MPEIVLQATGLAKAFAAPAGPTNRVTGPMRSKQLKVILQAHHQPTGT